MYSSIFGKGSRDSKINKAEELARVIIKMNADETIVAEGRLVIYMSQSGIDYSETILKHAEQSVLGKLITRPRDGKKYELFGVFLNYDRIYESIGKKRAKELFRDLALEETVTNLFVYVLLHEIGHYKQIQFVKNKGVVAEFDATKEIPNGFPEDTSKRVIECLSVPELFAHYFACRKIHYVLSRLEKRNPEYLTYLN